MNMSLCESKKHATVTWNKKNQVEIFSTSLTATETDLRRAMKLIENNLPSNQIWRLTKMLHLGDATTDQILNTFQHVSYPEVVHQLLLCWIHKNGEAATIQVLFNALISIGENELAENICLFDHQVSTESTCSQN